jgi:hypothetical protein
LILGHHDSVVFGTVEDIKQAILAKTRMENDGKQASLIATLSQRIGHQQLNVHEHVALLHVGFIYHPYQASLLNDGQSMQAISRLHNGQCEVPSCRYWLDTQGVVTGQAADTGALGDGRRVWVAIASVFSSK